MEPIKFDWSSGFGTKTEQACHYRQDRQVNKQYPGDNDRLAKFCTKSSGPIKFYRSYVAIFLLIKVL